MCHQTNNQESLLSSSLKRNKECKKVRTFINQHAKGVPSKSLSVSFAPSEHNKVYEIEYISKDIIEWVWYSEMEISVMNSRNMDILVEMDMGIINEDDNNTSRGLEWFGNGEEIKRRQQVIKKSIHAVLDEQKRQKQIGISNPRIIASKYRVNGVKRSQKYAAAVGLQDQYSFTEIKRTVLKSTAERLNQLVSLYFNTGIKANSLAQKKEFC